MKKIIRASLSHKSGVYSCLAFFSLGMLGIAPLSPQIQKNIPVSNAETTKQETRGVNSSLERCYWQEDVAQFLSLQEGKKNVSQENVPCEENLFTRVPITEKKQEVPDTELGATIREMTDGYPIAEMAPVIATYDREVAALIVGIAKKESDWGKHVPLDSNGNDCFNYWGYKGAGTRGIAMGHGCFGSREEAVQAVGGRLKTLVALRETSDPANLVVWKCGSSCKGHTDASVKKWVSDVTLYYNRIANK